MKMRRMCLIPKGSSGMHAGHGKGAGAFESHGSLGALDQMSAPKGLPSFGFLAVRLDWTGGVRVWVGLTAGAGVASIRIELHPRAEIPRSRTPGSAPPLCRLTCPEGVS